MARKRKRKRHSSQTPALPANPYEAIEPSQAALVLAATLGDTDALSKVGSGVRPEPPTSAIMLWGRSQHARLPWAREASVRIAVAAADAVLGLWEDEVPNDARPRLAVEAAREWVQCPCTKHLDGARTYTEQARLASNSVADNDLADVALVASHAAETVIATGAVQAGAVDWAFSAGCAVSTAGRVLENRGSRGVFLSTTLIRRVGPWLRSVGRNEGNTT